MSTRSAGPENVPSRAMVLSKAAEHALQLKPNAGAKSLGLLKSSAEFLAVRSYQGLEMRNDGSDAPTGIVVGRKGRAAGYADEAGPS